MKICNKCLLEKETLDFYKHPLTKDQLYPSCKTCCSLYYQENKERLRSQRRKSHLKRTYDLSLDEQQSMLEMQHHACAICETPVSYEKQFGKRINIDHNHATGKVRGILCPRCNMFVGMLEVPGLAYKARLYLQEADGTTFSN